MIAWLSDGDGDVRFPPTAQALGPRSRAPGLLAAGGTLSLARLEAAYRHGIFPWYGQGEPVLWWAPDPRMVLRASEFKLHRSLRKTLQRFLATPGCELRFDGDFDAVIAACAATPREGQSGTWIVPELRAAYSRWHRAGAVHSIETRRDGVTVGGLYGVLIGRMFFGESMFSHAADASKLALAALVAFCRAEAIEAIDCQQATRHLASLGAREWPRREFERHVAAAVAAPTPHWTYDRQRWATLGIEAPDPA